MTTQEQETVMDEKEDRKQVRREQRKANLELVFEARGPEPQTTRSLADTPAGQTSFSFGLLLYIHFSVKITATATNCSYLQNLNAQSHRISQKRELNIRF